MGRETIPEAGIDPAALVALIPALFGNRTNTSQNQQANVDPAVLQNAKGLIAQLTGESTNPHQDLIDSILQKSAVNFAPTRALENSSGGYNSSTLKLLQDNARGEATSQAVQAVLTAQRQAADSAARLTGETLQATRSVSTTGTTQQKGSIVPLAASVAAASLLKRLNGGKTSVTMNDVKNAGEPILNKFGVFSPRQKDYASGSDDQFEPNHGGSLGESSGGAGTPAGAVSFGDSSSGAAYTSDMAAGFPVGTNTSSFLTPDDIAASIDMATQGAASNAALLHTATSSSVADNAAQSAMQPQVQDPAMANGTAGVTMGQGQAAPQSFQAAAIEQPAYANAPQVRPGPAEEAITRTPLDAEPQVRAGPAEEQITRKPLEDPNAPIVKGGPSNYDNIVSGASLSAPTDAGSSFLNTLRPTPNMSIIPGTEPQSLFPHAEPNMSVAPTSFLQSGGSPLDSGIEDTVIPGIGGSGANQTPVTVGGDYGGASAADNLANTTPSDYGDFGGASLADDAANQAGAGALTGTGQIPILGPALQVAQGEPGAAGANIGITYGLTSIGIPFPVAAFVGQNLGEPVNGMADDLIRGIGDAGRQTGTLIADVAKNADDFLSHAFSNVGHEASSAWDHLSSGVSDFFDSFGF